MTFDLESGLSAANTVPTIELNDGHKMPIIGLGTYAITGHKCVEAVYGAIKNGYRLIDTASFYRNEKEVSIAVRKAIEDGIVTRNELYIVTKLYPNQYGHAEKAIDSALANINCGYIDMMLLHHPASNDVKAYIAMENAHSNGDVHSLGVSNYYINEVSDFLKKVSVRPAMVQNEIHPYYQDREVVRYIQSLGILVQSWYPLGGRGFQRELLHDPVLMSIAEKKGKSVSQVILRWDLQNNVAIVPGSGNPTHQRENLSLFDFELSEYEMNQINQLNRNEKHDWY